MIVGVNGVMQGIGYGLLVLFFAMGIFQTAAGFRELQRPEFAIRHFIRFAAAKVAVGYGMELMTAIFRICNGIVQSVMGGIGGMASMTATLPAEIVTAVEDVGFLASIPLWLVSLLGSLLVWVMSFILILTVYGRFFRLPRWRRCRLHPLLAKAHPPLERASSSPTPASVWRAHWWCCPA